MKKDDIKDKYIHNNIRGKYSASTINRALMLIENLYRNNLITLEKYERIKKRYLQ